MIAPAPSLIDTAIHDGSIIADNAQEFVKQRSLDLQLLADVAADVALVEEELRHRVSSQVALVDRVARLTLDAGGKRLRPAFVGLAAKAVGTSFDSRRITRLGACMEMIHMATLIHDDVIDEAKSRRGKPTAAAELGNHTAILSGDVLLAKAMLALAEDGDVSVIQEVSEAVHDMAEGEVEEIEARSNFDLTTEQYNRIITRKTGRFIEACCGVGATIAGATTAEKQALRDFGSNVGFAFQIVDDILDYRGDRARTGKSTGTDFRDGQMTLPLMFLRAELSEAESKIARARFGNGASEDEIRMISDWMDTRGAFERCEAAAESYVLRAKSALASLPETHARKVLGAVADYVLMRRG